MAGIMSRMFPEWQSTVEAYAPAAKAIGRGIQATPSGLLDLASLPFTLTGITKPEDVPGSTAWMDKKGFLIPKQTGDGSASDRFILDSLELGASLVLPAKLGGAAVSKAEQLAASKKVAANPATATEIPANRGQKNNDIKQMSQAARLAHDEAFAQRIAEFTNHQERVAENIVNGFKRSVGSQASKGNLGQRLADNFGTWFNGVKKTYKDRNDANFDKVLTDPVARAAEIPPSITGMDRIDSFVSGELAKGGDPAYKAALMDLKEQALETMSGSMSVQGLGQRLRVANESFTRSDIKAGPYDTVSKSNLDRIRSVYKQSLKDRLEDTVAMGGKEGALAADLKQANHIFEKTTENLKHIQEQSLARFLDAKDGQILNPEVVTDRFKKLTPGERQFFTAVSNKVDPSILPMMRRHLFDDIVAGGVRKGRSSGETAFDIGGFLSKADDLKTKNPDMYDWIIGSDPKIKAKFEGIIDQARTAINSGPSIAEASPKPGDTARRVGSAAFGAVSGKIGAARVADSIASTLQSFATDKEALFKHLFEDGPPPPGAASVVWDKAKKGVFSVVTAPPKAVGRALTNGPGLTAGVAAEVAEDLQQAPPAPPEGFIDPSMLLESPETPLEASETMPTDAELSWGSESPVEPSMAVPTDEELKW